MHEFAWKGIDREGRMQSGRCEADGIDEVRRRLSEMGLMFLDASKRAKSTSTGRVRDQELIDLTYQLFLTSRSGVPLLVAVDQLMRDRQSPAMQRVLEKLKEGINRGDALATTLERMPEAFDGNYVQAVRAGEESGRLPEVFERLQSSLTWRLDTKRAIRGAMVYPIVVLLAATGLAALVVLYLVPRVAGIFEKSGTELPALTRAILAFSRGVNAHWPFIVVGMGLALAGLVLGAKTNSGRRALDNLLLRTPLLGRLWATAQSAAYSNSMSLLVSSGVPFERALAITTGAMVSPRYQDAVRHVHERVIAGCSLSTSMEETGVFPGMLLRLVATGEQTGSVDTALARASEYFDRELPRTVQKIVKAIGPLFTLIGGIVVAFAVIAAFLPLLKMMSAIRAT